MLALLPACTSTATQQEQDAERAVLAYMQQYAKGNGTHYEPGSFETNSFPCGKTGQYRCHQIRHTYTVTVEKGEIMQEKRSFYVDSAGTVRLD